MANNIDILRPLLDFPTNDVFYFMQLIQRKKEHPELGSNNRIIKTYYINNMKYLEQNMNEIIHMCDYYNARAMINLNKRSYEKIAMHTLQKITDKLINKDYVTMSRAYDSACGKYPSDSHKKWIIDVDDPNMDSNKLSNLLYSLDPIGNKIYLKVPTKNGYHLITSPFNAAQYNKLPIWEQFEIPNIHKNNPTILYWTNNNKNEKI